MSQTKPDQPSNQHDMPRHKAVTADLPPAKFVPLKPYRPEGPPEDLAREFYEEIRQRRTVRMYSDRAVSLETLEWCVRAAGTAPSGANKQPWRFVCVNDPALKREIRLGAEEEEREFYGRRASERWIRDLHPFGTDDDKKFLEVAPWLVVVFKLVKDDDEGQTYYTDESVGIACGLFLAAAHHAGLATVTHTPSPMKFLGEILNRPPHERPFLLIPVGYPAEDCVVPDIGKKPLEKIMVVNRGG
jgi:nitroreductase